MSCRCLVVTDTFEASNLPHLLLTALGLEEYITNEDALFRENKYKDLAGILLYKDVHEITEEETNYMHNLVESTGKSLLQIVDAEQYLSGKLFYKEDKEVHSRNVQVHSNNDINFDVWLDSQSSLWNPVDFLLDGGFASSEVFQSLDDGILISLHETLEDIKEKLDYLIDMKSED